MLLILIVNMDGLFLQKLKNGITTTNEIQKSQVSMVINQIKYG